MFELTQEVLRFLQQFPDRGLPCDMHHHIVAIDGATVVPTDPEAGVGEGGDIAERKDASGMEIDQDIETGLYEIPDDRVHRNHSEIKSFPGKQIHSVLRELLLGKFFLVDETHRKEVLLVSTPHVLDVLFHHLEVRDVGRIIKDTYFLRILKGDRRVFHLPFTGVFPQLHATQEGTDGQGDFHRKNSASLIPTNIPFIHR